MRDNLNPQAIENDYDKSPNYGENSKLGDDSKNELGNGFEQMNQRNYTVLRRIAAICFFNFRCVGLSDTNEIKPSTCSEGLICQMCTGIILSLIITGWL